MSLRYVVWRCVSLRKMHDAQQAYAHPCILCSVEAPAEYVGQRISAPMATDSTTHGMQAAFTQALDPHFFGPDWRRSTTPTVHVPLSPPDRALYSAMLCSAHARSGFGALTVQEVPNHVQVPHHSPAHAAGQAHDLAIPVPDRADAVQRAFHSCPVVPPKGAHGGLCCIEVRLGHLAAADSR